MKKAKVCAVIVNKDLAAIARVEPLADLFEVRIDLIGDGWPEVAQSLKKPWIATNRLAEEGGGWRHSEARRKEELLKALGLGAAIVDIELRTKNLDKTVALIKKTAQCLVSFHDLQKTPPFDELKGIVKRQLDAGADIGKVVTTAGSIEDNETVLELIREFPESRLIAFAMGPLGTVSRLLCPLVGGQFSYASIQKGDESASGQITVAELVSFYRMVL